jgi:hypothetical protein
MVPLTFVPVPWTVSVADPVGVPDVVLTVSVVLAVPPDVSVTEAGLKDADAFAGTPVALSATAPVKPPVEVTLIVYVAVWPRVTDWLVGVMPSVMPGLVGCAAYARPAAASSRHTPAITNLINRWRAFRVPCISLPQALVRSRPGRGVRPARAWETTVTY